MYEIGEMVVYGCQGVYRIEAITHLDMEHSNQDRLYYVLVPTGSGTDKIYTPVDNRRITMRRVVTSEEAKALLEEFPSIETLTITNEKEREQQYKTALRSCDFRSWFGIIKTLRLRQETRLSQGKRITALDERYLRAAENEAYSELSLALGVPREQIEEQIRQQI